MALPSLKFGVLVALGCFVCHARSWRVINPNDVTLLDDVYGSYELENLKNSIKSNSLDNKKQIQLLSKKVASSSQVQGLVSSENRRYLNLQKSFSTLSGKVQGIKDTVNDLFKWIKNSVLETNSVVTSSIKEFKSLLNNKSQVTDDLDRKSEKLLLASDCKDLFDIGLNATGAFWLQKFGSRVLCDMETDGGGWLVIQNREKLDNQIDFDQGWSRYKMGFGQLGTEFWIGNDLLHLLTNQKRYELLIEMEDFDNGTYIARYSSFRVGNERSNYSLDVGDYSGNSSDAFTYHHGRPFTTKDRDNDFYEEDNCAKMFSGGGWYNRCYDAHVNGIFPDPPDRGNSSYITWWSRDDNMEKVPLVLIKVVMKIRPV